MSELARNKALVRRLIAGVNAGDLDAIEELATGKLAEAARTWVGPFRDSFPDFRMKVEDLIAEGEKVVAHLRCSGTHRGPWRGISATGRRFEDVDEIYIFRVEGDKLASVTAQVEDDLSRLRQLGISPS